MTCLETTFVIDLLQGDRTVKSLLQELSSREESVSIAAPSIMEVWSGALFAKASDSEKRKVDELLASLEILPLDEPAAKEAGEIMASLERAGRPIQTEDVMIAAIAKVRGKKLVTRDAHYARIPGLKVLKY